MRFSWVLKSGFEPLWTKRVRCNQILKEVILRRAWDSEQKQPCSGGLAGKGGHRIQRAPFLPESTTRHCEAEAAWGSGFLWHRRELPFGRPSHSISPKVNSYQIHASCCVPNLWLSPPSPTSCISHTPGSHLSLFPHPRPPYPINHQDLLNRHSSCLLSPIPTAAVLVPDDIIWLPVWFHSFLEGIQALVSTLPPSSPVLLEWTF